MKSVRQECFKITKTEANNRICRRISALEKQTRGCTFFKERKQMKIDALKDLQKEITTESLSNAVDSIQKKHPNMGKGIFSETQGLLDTLKDVHYYVEHRRASFS